MLSKTFVLLALSASAAVASPFHKRAEFHRHHRGTGTGFVPSGTGRPFPGGQNGTDGYYHPTGSILPITVSPLPVDSDSVPTGFNNAADEPSSCVTSKISTETSVNFVTVTASAAELANTKVVEDAGAFHGQSRTRGGNWGQQSSAVNSAPVDQSSAVPTTFVPSVTKSSGASASAPSASKPSASSSARSEPISGGSSGGKRGISYNSASLVSAFGESVSWAYNWGAQPDGTLNGVEYVPMMWGRNDVAGFADKVNGATHVLSFNEPDLGEQANIDPKTAAQLHREGMKDLVGKVKIGSPSVTNGATTSPPLGLNWLDAFFKACGTDCPVDFVTFHWYATADSFEYFKKHTEDIIKIANDYGVEKVWLTEFKPEGDANAQAAFMKQAVSYLDGNPAVERYAAFMASEGTMLNGGSLNPVGAAYAGSA